MSTALPPRPNLDWLRKTARQQLKALRASRPGARLADCEIAKLLVDAGASLAVRDKAHNSTPAHTARVAVTVTNNPDCAAVADYLDSLRVL